MKLNFRNARIFIICLKERDHHLAPHVHLQRPIAREQQRRLVHDGSLRVFHIARIYLRKSDQRRVEKGQQYRPE